MICKDCGIVLPWDGAKEIKLCTVCRKPFSTTADDVFRDGKFSICKEKREGQYQMALDIESAISNNETLLAEGGTGIGKSFAYLVPGILSGKRMVIATAKKTLQNQLFEKDLPLLREKMPYVPAPEPGRVEDDDDILETLDAETDGKFNFINIKGKTNYLCPDLVESALAKVKFPKEEVQELKSRLLQITQGVKYGYLHTWSERADFMELAAFFGDISVDNCPNQSCKFACRPKAKNYNIIVTNHHVLAYQLRYGEKILGKFDVLVVDEAHHFEDAVRSAYTDTVGVNYFKKSLKVLREDSDLESMLEDLGGTSASTLVATLRPLQERLLELAKYAREYMDQASKVIDQDKLREVATALLTDYGAELKETELLFTNVGKRMFTTMAGDYDKGHVLHGVSQVTKIASKITSLNLLVMQLKEPDPEKQFVLLYEERNNEQYIIRTPIEIGPLVQGALEKIPTKIFVSATLAVNKSFDYFKKRVGLDLTPLPRIRVISRTPAPPKTFVGDIGAKYNITERFYESPFDYKKQAKLYTPHHTYNEPIPNPSDAGNREKWFSAISKEVLRLCKHSDGDAFVLFTARTDLKEIAARTAPYFDQYGLNLLVQQEEGAEELLDQYRETDKSVLFGLKSFWEGIDVVGEKLRLVIIPKLPFPNQSDAVIKEMVKRAGKNWFQEVYVPKMLFDLRQGTGRLIRSTTDRGIIAILDARIWTGTSDASKHAVKWETLEKRIADNKAYTPAGYGKMVVLSLGFETVIDDIVSAVSFLKGL